MGIGTTSPDTTFDVNGAMIAYAYLNHSDVYVGDALKAVKKIKPKGKAKRGWAEVDHKSLPDGVRVKINQTRWYEKATKTEMPANFSPKDEKERKKYRQKTKKRLCGSLDGSVQLNLRAIVQLLEKVEALEAEVKELKKNAR